MANITMSRGDSVVLSGSLTLGGDPYDLSGASLWFTAKTKHTDADEDAIFQKTVGDGITVVSAAQGLISVAIDPDDTSSLSAVKTQLVWDLQVVDSEGNVYTAASGYLIVNPDVTESIA